MREEQQDLFGLFAPTPGVHKAPPASGGSSSRPAGSAVAGRVPVPPVLSPVPSLGPIPGEVEEAELDDDTMEEAAETDGELDIIFERSLRAQNYRLTLRRDGVAVATIPARGSEREARRFVELHREWLERARARQKQRPRAATVWVPGTHVLWRGAMTEIRIAATGERASVCLAADVFRVAKLTGDLRPTLEAHFLRRAKIELPARTWELSAITGMDVKNVTVRNQRSRWGSCSSNGVISLNWRLVQTPDFVRDYIIYHELMHLREMNHSERFWARVEEVCPGWRDAEAWIKRNGSLVGL